MLATKYREKLSFKPFGPVQNGRQSLYGLDYKTAMWRGDEDESVSHRSRVLALGRRHRRDPARLRGSRGITVLAGGTASVDDRTFTLDAAFDDPQYAIGENRYLAENASTKSYAVTVEIGDDANRWSYHEITMLDMREFDEPFPHTDHNTLIRVL